MGSRVEGGRTLRTGNTPSLERVQADAVAFWTDASLRDAGVLVAFSERQGGVSPAPFESLNLADHVGDHPARVDANRESFVSATGLSAWRERLTMAEQIHGECITIIDADAAGAGAFAASGLGPIAATDALVTSVPRVPIALCFADCVPIVLVAPGPMVAVVHVGWRGALASLPGKTASRMAAESVCEAAQVQAYVGAHIRPCHYQVSDALMSQFVNTFGTFARAESGGLDLDAVVSASLERAGVARCNIARLGTCTAEATDRFFSYRAEGGVTGRHAALACIL